MRENTINARPCTVHGRAFFLRSVRKFVATAQVIEPGEPAAQEAPAHARRGGTARRHALAAETFNSLERKNPTAPFTGPAIPTWPRRSRPMTAAGQGVL